MKRERWTGHRRKPHSQNNVSEFATQPSFLGGTKKDVKFTVPKTPNAGVLPQLPEGVARYELGSISKEKEEQYTQIMDSLLKGNGSKYTKEVLEQHPLLPFLIIDRTSANAQVIQGHIYGSDGKDGYVFVPFVDPTRFPDSIGEAYAGVIMIHHQVKLSNDSGKLGHREDRGNLQMKLDNIEPFTKDCFFEANVEVLNEGVLKWEVDGNAYRAGLRNKLTTNHGMGVKHRGRYGSQDDPLLPSGVVVSVKTREVRPSHVTKLPEEQFEPGPVLVYVADTEEEDMPVLMKNWWIETNMPCGICGKQFIQARFDSGDYSLNCSCGKCGSLTISKKLTRELITNPHKHLSRILS